MMSAQNTTNECAEQSKAPRRPVVVGLLGGVASGKSMVAGFLAELGARVIDADKIAGRALRTPHICAQLRQHWGDAPFDSAGNPDPARIAALVFSDPDKLHILNQLVHPPTRAAMRDELDAALRERTLPMAVIDAPLLVEAGLEAWCDKLIFVAATAAQRIQRAAAERHWDENEIRRRETHQDTLARKRSIADIVIKNNSSPEHVRALVAAVFQELTKTAFQEN